MAGTAKNFLTSAIDRVAEGAQNLGDWVSNKAQGLRSDTATPAPEAAVERPLSGAARSAVHGQEYTRNMGPQAFAESPGNAKSWTGATEAAVDSEFGAQGLRQPSLAEANAQARSARNPYLNTPEGQAGLRNAQQFGSRPPPPPTGPAGASAASSFPEVPKAGGLRSAVGATARGLGIAGTALAGADAALKANEGQTPEQLTGTGGAIQGGATEAYDNLTMGQGRRFAHGVKRAIGAFPALRSDAPEDQPARYPGGLRSIPARFGAGWDEGAALEAKAAALRGAPLSAVPAQPATNGQPAFSGGGNYMDVSDGQSGSAKATPEAIAGSNLIPAAGTGVIKRTTPGNVGPATGIGAPGDYRGENSYVASDRRPLGMRDAAITGAPSSGTPQTGFRQPGVFGELATMQGLRTKLGQDHNSERVAVVSRGQDITQRGQELAAETARRGQDATLLGVQQRIAYDQGKEARTNLGGRIAAQAEADVPQTNILGSEKSRAASVKQREAILKERFEYSLGDRADGKRMEQLTPTQQNLLMDGNKFMERATASRNTWGSFFRNFFGDKQFDSKNVYSYFPTAVEPSATGGYVVHFGNGNTATVPDIAGGGWNAFSPNDPVDADVMARVAKLIQEHKAKGAK